MDIAHNLSPFIQKLNAQTPSNRSPINLHTGNNVLLSQTNISGFFPISPVATRIPSGFKSKLIISSICKLKNLIDYIYKFISCIYFYVLVRVSITIPREAV